MSKNSWARSKTVRISYWTVINDNVYIFSDDGDASKKYKNSFVLGDAIGKAKSDS